MEEQQQQQKQEDRRRAVKLKWGSLELYIRGYDIIIIAILAGVGYLVFSNFHTVRANEVEHQQLITTVAEMVYVLTLDESERKELNLVMPHSLKEKVRGRRDRE